MLIKEGLRKLNNYGFVILTRVFLSCSEVSPEPIMIILTLLLEHNRVEQQVINKNKNQSRREFGRVYEVNSSYEASGERDR